MYYHPRQHSDAAAASNLVKRKMKTDEAMKILNIEQEKLTIENVKELFDKYYNANDPKNGGSFYLQSKIYRAKERLELDLDPIKTRIRRRQRLKSMRKRKKKYLKEKM